ncbi:MAG: HAMP domain-containing histidine kinase [Actinomycetota bacterium]|nr:HAMP domain-containing histidine kinase [Actinomycetota bacterium]
MSSRAAGTFPSSFRRRLALTYIASVAVATALLALGSLLFVREDKLGRFESNARREAQLRLNMVGATAAFRPGELPKALAQAGRVQVVVLAEGWAGSSHPALGPADVPVQLRSDGGDLQSAATEEARRNHLVVGGVVPGTSAQIFFFFDRSPVLHDIAMVGRVLLVAWLVVVALTSLVGNRLARRALWPVARGAEAAHAIAKGRLQTRLPVEGDDEFAAWASAFNRMANALEQRIGRERRFTADVAHELRTPLGALVTAASMLRQQVPTLPQPARRPAQLVDEQARRLRRLVEDLLEISRLGSGRDRVELEETELRSRVQHLVQARGWGRRVRVEGDLAWATIDGRRVDRVVANLVDNAIRHGGGAVAVSVTERGDQVAVEVSDEGFGVPAEEIPRLFEPFYKSDPSRPGPGNGLGLAIAAEHARMLGGRIAVSSQPGRGSRFTFLLPQEPPAADGGPTPSGHGRPLSPEGRPGP